MRDLRDWLNKVEELNEIEYVNGAHWNLELGGLTALWGPKKKCLLFDEIPGYPKGFRILTQSLSSFSRIAPTLRMEDVCNKLELARRCRSVLNSALIPPLETAQKSVFENVDQEKEVDLYKFPAPKWQELDGGRFLGTGCVVIITGDPDTSSEIPMNAIRSKDST